MLAYVTGAAGFVASHLTDRLLRDGHAVVAVDNLATGDEGNLREASANERFHVVRADVVEPWQSWIAALPEAFTCPDLVMHCASPASPVHYERLALETMAVNGVGTMHAVELARATGARLVYASASESCGDPLEHP